MLFILILHLSLSFMNLFHLKIAIFLILLFMNLSNILPKLKKPFLLLFLKTDFFYFPYFCTNLENWGFLLPFFLPSGSFFLSHLYFFRGLPRNGGNISGGLGACPQYCTYQLHFIFSGAVFFWTIPPSGPGGLPRYSDTTHPTPHQHAFLSMPFALARSGPGPWPDGPRLVLIFDAHKSFSCREHIFSFKEIETNEDRHIKR